MNSFANKFVRTPYFSLSQIFYRNISCKYTALLQKAASNVYRNAAYVPRTSIQEEILTEAVKNNAPTAAEWLKIKNSVLTNGRLITPITFNANVLGFCVVHKNYQAAKNFLEFIQNNNEQLNLAATGKFMKLYYVCNEISSEYKCDEELILSMYHNLNGKYPVLDSITTENVIHALSLTKEWKHCLQLLKNLKLTVKPSTNAYSVITSAAFYNDEFTLGWDLMNEMIALGKLPYSIVYNAWIDKFKNSKILLSKIDDLMSFFMEHDVIPSKNVTDNLLLALKPHSYKGTYTKLSKKGVCNCCKHHLEEIKMKSEDFEFLKSVFIDNVIIGKNVFNKTTPDELKAFKKFVKNLGSCDVVVDGLNVAYSAGVKKPSYVYAKLLANVVSHYRYQNKKVAVLGRLHMERWPSQYMNYIKSNSSLFLAENLSQDDPFVLYTTMFSGFGTIFLTRDLMRGHAYLLMETHLKKLFRRWQQLHQQSVTYIENDGQVRFKIPLPIANCTQKTATGWHVPYTDEPLFHLPSSLEPIINWLCIEKAV